jgi:pteridine reductase
VSSKKLGTALITGAAKRIGAAMALSLAKKGYDIALHYNKSDIQARDLQRKIVDLGAKCTLIKADLFDEKDVQNLVLQLKNLKNCNILINNASIFEKSAFLQEGEDLLAKYLQIHVHVPAILSEEFAKNCQENNLKGNIINMVDKNIRRYETKYFYYILTKKSLAEMTKMLALQLAPDIRVNAIAPGFILNSVDEKDPSAETARLLAKIPLQSKAGSQDIVNAMNFILENNFVTGEILFIDGGASLNHAG